MEGMVQKPIRPSSPGSRCV